MLRGAKVSMVRITWVSCIYPVYAMGFATLGSALFYGGVAQWRRQGAVNAPQGNNEGSSPSSSNPVLPGSRMMVSAAQCQETGTALHEDHNRRRENSRIDL